MLKNFNIYLIAFCLLILKGLVFTFNWETVSLIAIILTFKAVIDIASIKKPKDLAEDILSRVKSLETRLNLNNRNPTKL